MGRNERAVMKIKLHNSLAKVDNSLNFLFDDKVTLYLYEDKTSFTYQIDDYCAFLRFSSETKEFVELVGFGLNKKDDPLWFKGPLWDWTEI